MKKIYVGLFVLFCCLNVGITNLIAKSINVTSKQVTVSDFSDHTNTKHIKVDAAMTYQDLQNAIKTAFGKAPKTTLITSHHYVKPSEVNADSWENNARYNLNYDTDAELWATF